MLYLISEAEIMHQQWFKMKSEEMSQISMIHGIINLRILPIWTTCLYIFNNDKKYHMKNRVTLC